MNVERDEAFLAAAVMVVVLVVLLAVAVLG